MSDDNPEFLSKCARDYTVDETTNDETADDAEKWMAICPACDEEFCPEDEGGRQFCSVLCKQDFELSKGETESSDNGVNEDDSWTDNLEYSPFKDISKLPIFTLYNDLRFWSKAHFQQWFETNYALFGLARVMTIDRTFPNVIAETYEGDVLRIELELVANNFEKRSHEPNKCDLVISFVKAFDQKTVMAVPVLSIFNAKGLHRGHASYDPDSLVLTQMFSELVQVSSRWLMTALSTYGSGRSKGG